MTEINRTPRKNLSLTGLIEKSAVSSNDPLLMLVEFHIVDRFNGQVEQVIRVANIGQKSQEIPAFVNPSSGGIQFMGEYFQPAAFDVDIKEAAGEILEISFSMQDITGVVRGYMENYQGGVGSRVKLMLVFQSVIESAPHLHKPEYQEDYTVTTASIDGLSVRLGLGAKDLLAVRFPRRLQISQYCQWGYRSKECGYTGGMPTCDRTLQGANGCAVHGNTLNFGGFPGIQGRSVVR